MTKSKIILENIGKKYSDLILFSNINLELNNGDKLAVIGPNGSGRTSFLKILANYISASEGKILYTFNNNTIKTENIYKFIAIAAPYIKLIDDFTISEMINFHFRFKNKLNKKDFIIKNAFLENYSKTLVKNCSSGTQQRLKLALSIYSDVPFVLLDEPLSNLDSKGVEWYLDMMNNVKPDRIFIICSNNNEKEIFNCNKFLKINES